MDTHVHVHTHAYTCAHEGLGFALHTPDLLGQPALPSSLVRLSCWRAHATLWGHSCQEWLCGARVSEDKESYLIASC